MAGPFSLVFKSAKQNPLLRGASSGFAEMRERGTRLALPIGCTEAYPSVRSGKGALRLSMLHLPRVSDEGQALRESCRRQLRRAELHRLKRESSFGRLLARTQFDLPFN